MHMKTFNKTIPVVLLVLFGGTVLAQSTTYSLGQLTDIALKNNHILAIKQLQIEERQAKIKEDEVKRLPVVNVNGSYQYNFNLAEITIPAGTIGVIPLSATNQVPLPNVDKTFTVGKNNMYNAGVTAYQPLSQQAKIKTGVEASKLEVNLTEKEKQKITLQIKYGIEQLYFGILINQKQLAEAQAKWELAKAKLEDVTNALEAGKTIGVNRAGLLASIADEEQNILKLTYQIQNYTSDLAKLTGINDDNFEVESQVPVLPELPAYATLTGEVSSNPDLQMAQLTKNKAELGIKAAKLSDRPDVGLVAGYVFQSGNPISPMNNPFVGLNLKWNLQDLYTNKQVAKQRSFQLKQAQENILSTQQQLTYDLEKAYRKTVQSKSLIGVAEKALNYRREELKLQEDKQSVGMNLKTDLLTTKALIAKAEADVYAAQLAYILSVSEVKQLIGQ